MKYLTLVRHAKSSWDQPHLNDHDRPLNERGLRNAPEVAQFLAKNYFGIHNNPPIIPSPDHLLVSSALRTQQTARLMLEELKLSPEIIHTEPRAYLASAHQLLNLVRESTPQTHSLMLFAHNNGISDFANMLTKHHSIGDMPTCAVAIFELPVTNWEAVDWKQARLVASLTPKLIAKRFPNHDLPTPHNLDS